MNTSDTAVDRDGMAVEEDNATLFAEVYERLKAMAGSQLVRSGAACTLNTTALVHDLYLRMNAQNELTFARRAHFFAYAARAMRNLLIDHARQRLTLRAGGDLVRITVTHDHDELVHDSAEQALALETAIGRLEKIDARAAHVVELRYFGGLTLEQVAQTLGLARRTIDRDWRFACAFLQTELG